MAKLLTQGRKQIKLRILSLAKIRNILNKNVKYYLSLCEEGECIYMHGYIYIYVQCLLCIQGFII